MKKELLVPVGNYASLIAAINNGADAVYLAGKKYGARAFSENFTLEELESAVKTCHLYGVKIFITVNTLIYEKEIKDTMEYIDFLHKIGVDALIMQDIGLINIVHNIYPNLEIHASTQMHNHSKDNIKFLESLGIKRVVFARELSIEQINNIETQMEKEAFIHGSLCISYSGQCYFSKFVLDRSANRGMCAGMCRLCYELYENNKKIETKGKYILSPKDLCSIENFKKLMESDIYSFKIEGRMKSASYVGIVTKIYRNLIDKYNNNEELTIDEEDIKSLKTIYYRELTGGFLHNDKNIMNYKSSNHIGLECGQVTSFTHKKIEIKLTEDIKQGQSIRFKENDKGITLNFIYDRKDNLINSAKKGQTVYIDNFIELNKKDKVYITNPNEKEEKEITKKIKINIKFTANLREKIKLEITDGKNEVVVTNNEIDSAINSPITKEQMKKALTKTGNTPFIVEKIQINAEENIFVRNNIINSLRREAIEKLINIRTKMNEEYIKQDYKESSNNPKLKKGIYILARTKEQVEALKKYSVNIIVENNELYEDGFIFKPRRNDYIYNYNYPKIMNTSYASMTKYHGIISDYYLNITNHHALNLALNYNDIVTLSPENTYEDIQKINENFNLTNAAIYIYGKLELMMMKCCLIKNAKRTTEPCHACINNSYLLKDRNNAYYKVITDRINHTSYIMRNKNIDLIEDIPKYQKLGINNYRIDLLDETYEDVVKLMSKIEKNK